MPVSKTKTGTPNSHAQKFTLCGTAQQNLQSHDPEIQKSNSKFSAIIRKHLHLESGSILNKREIK